MRTSRVCVRSLKLPICGAPGNCHGSTEPTPSIPVKVYQWYGLDTEPSPVSQPHPLPTGTFLSLATQEEKVSQGKNEIRTEVSVTSSRGMECGEGRIVLLTEAEHRRWAKREPEHHNRKCEA